MEKLRAFILKTKEMCHIRGYFVYQNSPKRFEITTKDSPLEFMDEDELIVIRSTGAKDFQNNDIYQGDIILSTKFAVENKTLHVNLYASWKDNGPRQKGAVTWDDNKLMWKVALPDGVAVPLWAFMKHGTVEIVGNIYQ